MFVRTEGFSFDASVSSLTHLNTWKSKTLNSLNTVPFISFHFFPFFIPSFLPSFFFFLLSFCFHIFFLSAPFFDYCLHGKQTFKSINGEKFIKYLILWSPFLRISKGTQRIKLLVQSSYLLVMPWSSGEGWHFCGNSHQCENSGWTKVIYRRNKSYSNSS